MTAITYRYAREADIPMIQDMFAQGAKFLKDQGIDQWQGDEGFSHQAIQATIDAKEGYVWEDEKGVLAYSRLVDGDPDYEKVDLWQTPPSYLAIHRVMLADRSRGQGLSDQIFADYEVIGQKAGKQALRIDTHADNQPMQHIIKKNGYDFVGDVVIGDGLDRLAFEKMI